MNKQERIQIIQTIRKQTRPLRILSAVFTGGAFMAVHFFDQSIWSILMLLCALIISGGILRRESHRMSRLSDSIRAKRLIRLRSTMSFGIIALLLILIVISELLGKTDLSLLYVAGFMLLGIVIETVLERWIRRADPEQPLSNEYR
ncbi:hypothetical protein D3D03_04475 [Exiguobacterium sp. RIT452]|uniref:hypothetical protein n=1 Tax=unclassified Exiguobacterium TaxID=2644629 RepID=UPI000E70DC74|nr:MULTISPECIES: hypothetical protein [unclassified Exiguobacterium]RJP02607.1 hypothetical protein D3D03_04475 [Exiguobacterium sp. RIT452]